MSTVVYSLFSHTGVYLKAHLELLRRHVRHLSRIVLVQGPWGLDQYTSGGSVWIRPEVAVELGVNLVEAPDSFAGLVQRPRLEALYNWLLAQHVMQDAERHALIVHGDLFATGPVVCEELLGGAAAAGRGIAFASGDWFALTWLAVEIGSLWAPGRKPDVHCPATLGNVRLWAASDVRELAGTSYRAADHFEDCQPCWLHADRMSHCPGDAQRKLAIVAHVLGLQDLGDDPTQPARATLRWHVPRSR